MRAARECVDDAHGDHLFDRGPRIHPIGVAVICISARFISALCRGVAVIDRKHATPKQWKQIEAEMKAGRPTTPLPSSNVLAMVLADPIERQSLQWLHAMPVTVVRVVSCRRDL